MRRSRSAWVLGVVVVIATAVGTVLGNLLAAYLPFLARSYSVGLEPATLNLGVARITFGFLLNVNAGSLVGLILGVILARRL